MHINAIVDVSKGGEKFRSCSIWEGANDLSGGRVCPRELEGRKK